MKLNPALTLIEVLVVTALIAAFSVGSLIAYFNIQSKQALQSSVDRFANVAKSARIYARESKGGKAWGVKSVDSKSYSLVSGKKEAPVLEGQYGLESPVEFDSGFEFWFNQGEGTLNDPVSVRFRVERNATYKQVDISLTGVVQIL